MSDTEIQSPARYRLQIIINRDLVCPPEGLDEVVVFELGKLANQGYSCVAHNVNRLKERPQKKRIAEFTVDDVIPFISTNGTKDYVVNGQTYTVRMNSQRYFVFRDSLSCVSCGIVGEKMILEQHPGDKTAHFNLYAEENGELVLMTKDHIRAKSVGGEDRHSNYQTMCSICNNIKAHQAIGLEDLRSLRAIYNRNVNQMPKKELHKLIENAKVKMIRPGFDGADWIANYVTVQDVSLFAYTKEQMEAVSIYSAGDGPHIACISKGTPICGSQDRDWLMATLTDGTAVRIPMKFVRPWVKKYESAPQEPKRDTERCSESELHSCDDGICEERRLLDTAQAD
jgi:5-methylcytosine-specific restriction endonuclease McrA